MIITIDGPAGSGKSTLSVILAKELVFFCLNSGYLYRGMAYVLQKFYGYDEQKLKKPVVEDIVSCIESGDFRYEYESGLPKIYFKDDITGLLKQESVSKAAAALAQSLEARKVIRAYKRRLVAGKNSVAEGRVCGSVVFPDADLKLFVTASDKIRAQRFVQDQQKRGNSFTEQEALDLIVARDTLDMNRKHNPLVQPEDVVVFDTSNLSKEQMLAKAVSLVKNVMKK